MKSISRFIILSLCLALLAPAAVRAQVTLVRKGAAQGRILAPAGAAEQQAAELLRDFVRRISGADLPVVAADARPRRGDILLEGVVPTPGLAEDGFRLRESDGRLYLRSGGDKGSIYGVVTLLEEYLGVHYWASNEYSLTPSSEITLPAGIDRTENPAFRHRQTQCYAIGEDPVYKLWFRLEDPSEVFAGNLWVHTFNRLLPAARFGGAHPEWYSWINGERRTGRASQWCLTNDEVFEAACTQLDSIFRAHPDRRLISVSQNDGNDTYCHCPSCMRVIEEEGAVSGLYIRFLNRLAERFPDKEFSTLAYLFTMHPPKHVRPHRNVNIMLCDIDCDREVPLTENASGRDFMRALEGWSAISDNIFVWDYGINFDNMVAPFPNFHILQPNIRQFLDHHATMHFSQIGGSKGGDFSEMRAYVVSKLMWNPQQRVDSLMRSFTDGYYGAAGPFIYDYERTLEGALLASGQRLWIYDSPVSHKDGMLNAACRKRYNVLFDAAERAVAGDTTLLRRVRRARLPLQYAELEIARAEGWQDKEQLRGMLDLFERRTAEFGVRTLNERNNSPADYCALYRSRYLAERPANLASEATVQWILPPHERYRALGERALTDGCFGGSTFVENWVGWEGCDGAFVLDLGRECAVRSIETDFLHQLGAWILLPRRVRYATSVDNERFVPFGERRLEEDQSVEVKFVGVKFEAPTPVRARYIRVEIEGSKVCPSWHYGVGQPSWFFIDEIGVH